MSHPPSTPEERYAAIVEALLGDPDVTQSRKRGFGSGLRVRGNVFAMLVKGKLVIKLPQQRMATLIAAGEGEPYESGGRITKGWFAVEPTAEEGWLPLAREALAFAASKR